MTDLSEDEKANINTFSNALGAKSRPNMLIKYLEYCDLECKAFLEASRSLDGELHENMCFQLADDCLRALFHVQMKANFLSEPRLSLMFDTVFRQYLWSHMSQKKYHPRRSVKNIFSS